MGKGPSVGISTSPVKGHPRTLALGETLDHDMDRKTRPGGVRQSPASAPPKLVRWTYEWSHHSGRDGGSAWTPKHGLPLPRLTSLLLLLNVRPASNKDGHRAPNTAPIFDVAS